MIIQIGECFSGIKYYSATISIESGGDVDGHTIDYEVTIIESWSTGKSNTDVVFVDNPPPGMDVSKLREDIRKAFEYRKH